MSEIDAEGMKAIGEIFQPGQQPDFSKMQKLREEGEEKSKAVLTEEQKKELEEMKGDKFEFPAPQFGPPGGGGGGNGGRRRGGNGA